MNMQMTERFLDFLKGLSVEIVVLGCTEFPVLVDFVERNLQGTEREGGKCYLFFDPIAFTIDKLHEIMV